ncbi:hypothetical protein C0J52_16065, partial [Blattella germanica]
DFANKEINSAVTDRIEDKVNLASETEPEQPLLVNRKHVSSLVCKDCDLNFNTYINFKQHLLKHVQLPIVIVQRLNPSYVRRIILNKPLRSPHKGKKHNFARKRIRSYIVPKVNKKSLKLTLKLATDATTENPLFEVVPRKILVGPGDRYPANEEALDIVKTEVTSEVVEWESNRSVEGEGEKESEVGERTSETTLEANKNGGVNKAKSVGQDESEKKSREEEVTEDNFEEEEEEEEQSEKGGTGIDHSQGFSSACPSPTPSEQLRPEFLAPEEGDEDEDEDQDCDNPPSPAMVEVGGTAVGEAGSPAFPTTSPAPPPSGDSNSQHSLPDQSHQSSPENTDGHNSNHASDETALQTETNSFNWNDVGNVASGNGDDPSSNASALEERDPLMLPDQPSTEHDRENDESGNLSGSSSESLLRGFLCDPAGGDKAIAVTTPASGVGNVIDGLGSEYISLERLGETGAVACCDVCGEQTSNLEEHRARAGHYKCGHPECGSQVFPNLNELAGHQHVAHGGQSLPPPQATVQQAQPPTSSQPYPMPPPPVQQLAQQVQRLPIPPSQQLSPHQMNHHPQQQPMVQQMSPQLHQLMPAQQQYPQSPVRRPPPLYRVPGSANMPGAQGNVQYPNQQQPHMMPPQMYNQQSYSQQQNNFSGPSGPMTPPRPYGNMVQQMNRPRAPSQQGMQRPLMQQQQQQQMQQQPRMTMQQKRQAVVSGSPASSPNKQRRMDVLIPDRHDDADCHVIAMQKRTDSGPVIGNVQGAANNSGRPESMIHLTDSITLSVRQPQGGNSSNSAAAVGGKNKSDAKAVANILATRGITVTPAGGTGRQTTQQSPQQPQRPARQAPTTQTVQPPQPVTTLNLNSAISIIAQPTAASSRQQQGNFAVPHGRGSTSRTQQQQQIERPPRPPTVDLTGDGPPPPLMHGVSRGRGRGRGVMGRHSCQVCDKAFSTQESLNQHMALHRSPGKLPYRCSLCSAQYPTQQGLLQHRQAYHKEPAIQPGAELAVPVVDLKAPGSINRLAGLGIHHYIPLSQLGSQAGGYFGLPIISVEGTRNPGICNLGALGAASVLSLGPLKHLGR